MNSYALMVLEAFLGRGADVQKGIKAIGRDRDLFVADHVAALDRWFVRSAQIHRQGL